MIIIFLKLLFHLFQYIGVLKEFGHTLFFVVVLFLVGDAVFHGGPVHTERGFVLHDRVVLDDSAGDESAYASSLNIPGGLEMTTSRDVLEALSTGAGPKRVLVSLGYASWSEGQLESEITENSWLTVSDDASVIFETPVEQRYDSALALLGVQPWALSAAAGRA